MKETDVEDGVRPGNLWNYDYWSMKRTFENGLLAEFFIAASVLGIWFSVKYYFSGDERALALIGALGVPVGILALALFYSSRQREQERPNSSQEQLLTDGGLSEQLKSLRHSVEVLTLELIKTQKYLESQNRKKKSAFEITLIFN